MEISNLALKWYANILCSGHSFQKNGEMTAPNCRVSAPSTAPSTVVSSSRMELAVKQQRVSIDTISDGSSTIAHITITHLTPYFYHFCILPHNPVAVPAVRLFMGNHRYSGAYLLYLYFLLKLVASKRSK